MSKLLEKLLAAPAASFHVLDAAKAKRLNARTMFIPSPDDVANAIRAIPAGETRTVLELRRALAALGRAETACPGATNMYWKWMANLEVFEERWDIPWWRVLKDGRASRHMPGGASAQLERLRAEGVTLK